MDDPKSLSCVCAFGSKSSSRRCMYWNFKSSFETQVSLLAPYIHFSILHTLCNFAQKVNRIEGLVKYVGCVSCLLQNANNIEQKLCPKCPSNMYAKASYNYVQIAGYLDREVLRPTENCCNNNNNTMLWYNISLYESILHTLRRAYIVAWYLIQHHGITSM